MAGSDPSSPCIIGFGSSPSRCGPLTSRRPRSRSPGFRSRSLRTCQGLRPRRTGHALAIARTPVSPSAHDNGVGVAIDSFAAQWLACMHPCRRFAPGLAADDARLGADVVRYSFIAVDLHHLLLAGLPAHLCKNAATRDDDRINVLPNRVQALEDWRALLILVDLRKFILVASQFFEFLHSLDPSLTWGSPRLLHCTPIIQMR